MNKAMPRRLGALGTALLVLAVVLGLWVFLRGNDPFGIDVAWNTLLADWNAPFARAVSDVLNIAGGVLVSSFVVPVAAIAWLMLRKKPWSAGFFVTAVASSALVVQLLKHLFARARPEDILVVSDFGSFPSGHVANAATLATVLVVLAPRVWTAVLAGCWVLLMSLSRTELHAHWLSDTLGGALVGTGVALIAAAFMYRGIAAERRAVRMGRRPAG